MQIGKGPSLIVDYETGVTVLDDAGLKWRRRSKRDEGESVRPRIKERVRGMKRGRERKKYRNETERIAISFIRVR